MEDTGNEARLPTMEDQIGTYTGCNAQQPSENTRNDNGCMSPATVTSFSLHQEFDQSFNTDSEFWRRVVPLNPIPTVEVGPGQNITRGDDSFVEPMQSDDQARTKRETTVEFLRAITNDLTWGPLENETTIPENEVSNQQTDTREAEQNITTRDDSFMGFMQTDDQAWTERETTVELLHTTANDEDCITLENESAIHQTDTQELADGQHEESNGDSVDIQWSELTDGSRWILIAILCRKRSFEQAVKLLRLTSSEISAFTQTYISYHKQIADWTERINQTPVTQLIQSTRVGNQTVNEYIHNQRPALPTDQLGKDELQKARYYLIKVYQGRFAKCLDAWYGMTRSFVEIPIKHKMLNNSSSQPSQGPRPETLCERISGEIRSANADDSAVLLQYLEDPVHQTSQQDIPRPSIEMPSNNPNLPQHRHQSFDHGQGISSFGSGLPGLNCIQPTRIFDRPAEEYCSAGNSHVENHPFDSLNTTNANSNQPQGNRLHSQQFNVEDLEDTLNLDSFGEALGYDESFENCLMARNSPPVEGNNVQFHFNPSERPVDPWCKLRLKPVATSNPVDNSHPSFSFFNSQHHQLMTAVTEQERLSMNASDLFLFEDQAVNSLGQNLVNGVEGEDKDQASKDQANDEQFNNNQLDTNHVNGSEADNNDIEVNEPDNNEIEINGFKNSKADNNEVEDNLAGDIQVDNNEADKSQDKGDGDLVFLGQKTLVPKQQAPKRPKLTPQRLCKHMRDMESDDVNSLLTAWRQDSGMPESRILASLRSGKSPLRSSSSSQPAYINGLRTFDASASDEIYSILAINGGHGIAINLPSDLDSSMITAPEIQNNQQETEQPAIDVADEMMPDADLLETGFDITVQDENQHQDMFVVASSGPEPEKTKKKATEHQTADERSVTGQDEHQDQGMSLLTSPEEEPEPAAEKKSKQTRKRQAADDSDEDYVPKAKRPRTNARKPTGGPKKAVPCKKEKMRTLAQLGMSDTPIGGKRGRGRPRKYARPDEIEALAAQASKAGNVAQGEVLPRQASATADKPSTAEAMKDHTSSHEEAPNLQRDGIQAPNQQSSEILDSVTGNQPTPVDSLSTTPKRSASTSSVAPVMASDAPSSMGKKSKSHVPKRIGLELKDLNSQTMLVDMSSSGSEIPRTESMPNHQTDDAPTSAAAFQPMSDVVLQSTPDCQTDVAPNTGASFEPVTDAETPSTSESSDEIAGATEEVARSSLLYETRSESPSPSARCHLQVRNFLTRCADSVAPRQKIAEQLNKHPVQISHDSTSTVQRPSQATEQAKTMSPAPNMPPGHNTEQAQAHPKTPGCAAAPIFHDRPYNNYQEFWEANQNGRQLREQAAARGMQSQHAMETGQVSRATPRTRETEAQFSQSAFRPRQVTPGRALQFVPNRPTQAQRAQEIAVAQRLSQGQQPTQEQVWQAQRSAPEPFRQRQQAVQEHQRAQNASHQLTNSERAAEVIARQSAQPWEYTQGNQQHQTLMRQSFDGDQLLQMAAQNMRRSQHPQSGGLTMASHRQTYQPAPSPIMRSRATYASILPKPAAAQGTPAAAAQQPSKQQRKVSPASNKAK